LGALCGSWYASARERAPADKSVGEKEGGPSFGTGFFVADGYVLTNYHVIKSCSKAFVKYPGYRAEPAYEAGSDEINDLVLLRTKLPNQGVAEFRFQPKLGEPVASYGFPLGQVLAPEGNFTLGNITGTTGIGGDTRHFQMSAPIQPGNSGGPVLDMSGHVVGAAVASLSDAKMVAVTGQVPQNVNFAIAAPIAVNFLMNKEVTPKLGVAGDKLEPERLAETAKKFTVQVSCE
jgi:serine protease Do